MPKKITHILIAMIIALLVVPLATLQATEKSVPAALVKPLSLSWSFHTTHPPKSTLTPQVSRAEFASPGQPDSSFTVKLAVDLKRLNAEKTILEIPEVLSVRLRRNDPRDRGTQNYPAFKMPDGSVPVLEATLMLHSDDHPAWKTMIVGVPLAMLEHPEGEHEVVLNFTGVRWTIYVDGELMDNDFPYGYPRWSAKNDWKIDAEQVKQAEIHFPAITPEAKPASRPAMPVQYWMPAGFNAWVGDVATFFHQGRYHVFYLFDRRHHHSKFGAGSHYFEHLSTADFKTWTEHEAATPIENQWECIGTGTPFDFNGKLCIAYGLHTERIYPMDKTTMPAQQAFLAAHGKTGSFNRSTPGVPVGSTYSISDDGVANFKKTWTFFHYCRNPSVYHDPDGRLRMLANGSARGTWEADSPDGGWRSINPIFPPGGDCTFFFHWGRFDYIIGGFRGLWSKPAGAPETAYEDVVRKGLDFYDGLNVPAITEISGGRFLMAGWTTIRGWGGNLVIRELVQLPDGRIGSKWMDEIMPATEEPRNLAAKVEDTMSFPTESKSFLLTFQVQPKSGEKGRLGISFLPERGEDASCELQISSGEKRAQFGPGSPRGFAAGQKSLRKGGRPEADGNYAIENLLDVDRPFTVRVVVKGDDKIGGSLIDAEIAGKRTMLSYRPELTSKRLTFRTEGLAVKDMQIMTLAK